MGGPSPTDGSISPAVGAAGSAGIRVPGPSSGGATAPGAGGGAGGGVPGGGSTCPESVEASLTGPIQGITAGMPLRVDLDMTVKPDRVVIVEPVADTRIGAISGIPDLQRLIDCLRSGVRYDAAVTAVDGGRIDIRIQRRDG